MNIHQLELFYQVVLHQGVSQAARALQKEQPTLSRQINELEDALRVRLYHRRPFKLTEKGELLFQGIEQFFRDLPKLEEKVKGGDLIRIGASPIVLTHHLPAVEKLVRKEFPNLRLLLREANQPQLLRWLEQGEIDLAVTLLPRDVPPKVFAKELFKLRLILLVPEASRVTTAEQLWAQAEIKESLISLTADEIVSREFQNGLERKDLEWRPRIEVGSLDLVEHYVVEGYGVGLSVRAPGFPISFEVRAIELPDWPEIPMGLLWRDDTDKLVRAFRAQVEHRAALLSCPSPD
jgi:LysR family cys regulon transcriptional activator